MSQIFDFKTPVYHAVLIVILVSAEQTTNTTPVYQFVFMTVPELETAFCKYIPVLPRAKTNDFDCWDGLELR